MFGGKRKGCYIVFFGEGGIYILASGRGTAQAAESEWTMDPFAPTSTMHCQCLLMFKH